MPSTGSRCRWSGKCGSSVGPSGERKPRGLCSTLFIPRHQVPVSTCTGISVSPIPGPALCQHLAARSPAASYCRCAAAQPGAGASEPPAACTGTRRFRPRHSPRLPALPAAPDRPCHTSCWGTKVAPSDRHTPPLSLSGWEKRARVLRVRGYRQQKTLRHARHTSWVQPAAPGRRTDSRSIAARFGERGGRGGRDRAGAGAAVGAGKRRKQQQVHVQEADV